MLKVTFLPDNRTISVAPGTTVLEAARQAGVLIEAPCNGAGVCGKCAVLVPSIYLKQLELHDPPQSIDPVTSRILACHAELKGDVTITVPQQQEDGLVVVGSGLSRTVALAPYITRAYDAERGETAVRGGETLLAAEPGNSSAINVGIVYDIGTTTLVAALINLGTGNELASVSALNPQSLHAQDVLSRIRFASNPEGLEQLQGELLSVLNSLTEKVCRESGIAPELVYEVIFSGNTCMLHLAAGADPSPLGKIPF